MQLTGKDAAGLGRLDAEAAVSAARAEGFAPGAIIFSIRKRAAGCCRNRALIFSHGSKPYGVRSIARVSIVRVFPFQRAQPGSPRRDRFWTMRANGPWLSGWSTTSARPLRGAGYRENLTLAKFRGHGLAVTHGHPARSLPASVPITPRITIATRPGVPHNAQTFVDLNMSGSANPSGGR